MKLVYNPGNSPVVYEDGRMIDPKAWAYVSDDRNDLDRRINEGSLIEKRVPDTIPDDVDPNAYAAIKLAVEDQEQLKLDLGNSTKNDDSAPVRNTGAQSKPKNAPKTQNKEA